MLLCKGKQHLSTTCVLVLKTYTHLKLVLLVDHSSTPPRVSVAMHNIMQKRSTGHQSAELRQKAGMISWTIHNTLQKCNVFRILVASKLCPFLSSLPLTYKPSNLLQNRLNITKKWKRIWMFSFQYGIMLRISLMVQGLHDGPLEWFLLGVGPIRPWYPPI